MSSAASHRGVARIVVLSVVAALTAGGAASAKTAAKPVTATSSLSALVKQTSAVPTTAITRARRASLLRIAVHARHVVVRNPCGAVADLNRFRASLKRATLSRSVKRSRRTALQRRLAALGAASLTASSKLLALSKTKRCGGAIKPNKLTAATATVLKSDVNGMTVRVKLPAVEFVPTTRRRADVDEDRRTQHRCARSPARPHPRRQQSRSGAGRRDHDGRAGSTSRTRSMASTSSRAARAGRPDAVDERATGLQEPPFASAPFTSTRRPTTDKVVPLRRPTATSSASRATSRSAACRSRPPSTTRPPQAEGAPVGRRQSRSTAAPKTFSDDSARRGRRPARTASGLLNRR